MLTAGLRVAAARGRRRRWQYDVADRLAFTLKWVCRSSCGWPATPARCRKGDSGLRPIARVRRDPRSWSVPPSCRTRSNRLCRRGAPSAAVAAVARPAQRRRPLAGVLDVFRLPRQQLVEPCLGIVTRAQVIVMRSRGRVGCAGSRPAISQRLPLEPKCFAPSGRCREPLPG